MGGRASRTELQDIPFGMLVLEVLLDATAGTRVDRGGAGVLHVWNHGAGGGQEAGIGVSKPGFGRGVAGMSLKSGLASLVLAEGWRA
jgi:hypothetical protein